MTILVAVKQVPNRDSLLRPDASGVWIDESNLEFETNEADAYALETALQLSDRHGGEVVVLAAGPERAAKAIREALARGATRAVHVLVEKLEQLDAFATGTLLAAAARKEAPDLILTGLQSDDLGYGQTGVIMAELLGFPHATLILDVERTPEGIRVKRELEGGWFQHIEMPLPAVLTIQSGSAKLRYATLMGIKKAKSKDVRRVPVAELGPVPEPAVLIERLYPPQRVKQTQLLEGNEKEEAARLVDKLAKEARVL
jgi:electron transfer flavoprotein beta subunit